MSEESLQDCEELLLSLLSPFHGIVLSPPCGKTGIQLKSITVLQKLRLEVIDVDLVIFAVQVLGETWARNSYRSYVSSGAAPE